MATTLRGVKAGTGGKLSSTAKGYVYTQSLEYVVISDVKDETIFNVLNTSGLPRIGFTSTSFANAVCRDLAPKQDTKSPYVWHVTAEFTTEPLNQDTGSDDPDNPDPTAWVPLYKGTIETFPEVMFEDFSASPKKYVNSAGKKFPEPLIRNRPIIVYSFQQYIASSVTDVQIGEYNDTINLTAFKGFGADTLKCTIADFERGFFYGRACTLLSVKVAYKRNKWLDKPLDMGYEYRPTAGAQTVASPGGKLVSLASDGTLRPDTSDPLALEFVPHKRVEFSTFLR
jgi:hypothetical protein